MPFLQTCQEFFYMGGHGVYVFSAYSSVIILLGVQWLVPWRRWRRHLQQQNQFRLQKNLQRPA